MVEKSRVQHIQVAASHAGRRIDNFLMGLLKDVPRARIYQMIRRGEVRVNSARVNQDHRLEDEDTIRIPPLIIPVDNYKPALKPALRVQEQIRESILYEDDSLLVINKPSGIAVHGGSGEVFGVIETLRILRPACDSLELVHRLDKLTSGCLLLAKDHRYLRELHEMLRCHRTEKTYTALLLGKIPSRTVITLPLIKSKLQGGERVVRVDPSGKESATCFYLEQAFMHASLARIELRTGRTHQIRVHAAHWGHPVAGDDKYGDREFNRHMRRAGLKRMFLHAASISLPLPHMTGGKTFTAPLSDELSLFLRNYSRLK